MRFVLEITPEVHTAILGAMIRSLPNEGCGLLTARSQHSLVDHFHAAPNGAASPTRFVVDPQTLLDVERDAEASGREVVAIVHSHVDTSPYPSATDVADAQVYDPAGHYLQVIVSLRHAEPELRCFRIERGLVTEILVTMGDGDPAVGDGAGAIAAVRQLPPRS